MNAIIDMQIKNDSIFEKHVLDNNILSINVAKNTISTIKEQKSIHKFINFPYKPPVLNLLYYNNRIIERNLANNE